MTTPRTSTRWNVALAWRNGKAVVGCDNRTHMVGSSGTAGSTRAGGLRMIRDRWAGGPSVLVQRAGGRTTWSLNVPRLDVVLTTLESALLWGKPFSTGAMFSPKKILTKRRPGLSRPRQCLPDIVWCFELKWWNQYTSLITWKTIWRPIH